MPPLISGTTVPPLPTGGIWYTWVAPTQGVTWAASTQSATTTPFSTQTNTATFNLVWTQWSTAQYVQMATVTQQVPYARLPAPSSMDLRAAANRRRQEMKRAGRPHRKAETLLLKHLSRQQRLTWINGNYFEFNVGTRLYRIKRGKVGNVELRDAQGVVATFCCHPANDVPQADIAMSQWMMLLYDEPGFLRLANVHFRRPTYRPPLPPPSPASRVA